MLTLLAKLLKVLNSDDNPKQIAAAVVLAAFMGLTPLSSPHNIVLLLLVLLVRIQLTMFLLSFASFTLFAYLLDPVSHWLGASLLNAPALVEFWTTLYNSNVWRLMAFNNTLVLGSFCIALLISIPLFLLTQWLVINYRSRIMAWVKQSRLAIWLKGGKVYAAYSALTE